MQKDIVSILKNENRTSKELEEFSRTKEMEVPVDGENILKYPFNVEKIIKLFQIKLDEEVENSEVVYANEDDKPKTMDRETELEVVSQLEVLYAYKLFQLKVECGIEYAIKQPRTEVENLEYEMIVQNKVRKIFGQDIEDKMAQILAKIWIRDIELVLSEEYNEDLDI